jgi:hypothetical protein
VCPWGLSRAALPAFVTLGCAFSFPLILADCVHDANPYANAISNGDLLVFADAVNLSVAVILTIGLVFADAVAEPLADADAVIVGYANTNALPDKNGDPLPDADKFANAVGDINPFSITYAVSDGERRGNTEPVTIHDPNAYENPVRFS